MPTVEIVNGAAPEFVSAIDCEALVVPTICEAKVRPVGDSVTAGAVPVPLTPRPCGLPAASSAIDRLPVLGPAPDGEKVTETVHVPLTGSVVGVSGQLLVTAKSPAFVPVIVRLLIVSGALPVFASVDVLTPLVVPTCCEPKLRVAGVKLTAGAGDEPVPLRPRVCGVLGALSATVTLAERAPDALGENLTEIVHVAFTATVAGLSGHVVVSLKSPGFVPATAIAVIANAAVPEFVSVVVEQRSSFRRAAT